MYQILVTLQPILNSVLALTLKVTVDGVSHLRTPSLICCLFKCIVLKLLCFENIESIKKLNRAAHSNYKKCIDGENGNATKINVLSSCLNGGNRGNR